MKEEREDKEEKKIKAVTKGILKISFAVFKVGAWDISKEKCE